MKRSTTDKWLGGVLGGIAHATGISSGILRIIFLVLFFGIGGLSFGVGWGAVALIYFLCWIILPN
jgi:phage shock protein C